MLSIKTKVPLLKKYPLASLKSVPPKTPFGNDVTCKVTSLRRVQVDKLQRSLSTSIFLSKATNFASEASRRLASLVKNIFFITQLDLVA